MTMLARIDGEKGNKAKGDRREEGPTFSSESDVLTKQRFFRVDGVDPEVRPGLAHPYDGRDRTHPAEDTVSMRAGDERGVYERLGYISLKPRCWRDVVRKAMTLSNWSCGTGKEK